MLNQTEEHPPMPHAEKFSQKKSAAPGLVLLDPSLRPVSYNTEAIQILTYPKVPKDIRRLAIHVEAQIHLLLDQHRLSGNALIPAFQSGRRQYAVRMFTLSNHRGGSSSSSGPYAAHVILLERQDWKLADLSTVAAQFRLTPREQETLRFLTLGMTSKEIANLMGISPHTVKAFVRMIKSKMQVSTRSAMLGKILRIGL
jgi:DNA-binding CsgD family transcriptional regulator